MIKIRHVFQYIKGIFFFVCFGMNHPNAQLIANIAERGLYAAATAGGAYLAHQTTGPLGGFTETYENGALTITLRMAFCNAFGIGCSD